MKTRTILAALFAGVLCVSVATPVLAGPGQKQIRKQGSATGSGVTIRDRDRLKDGSCQQ